VPFVLAEAARSECAPSMRAVKGSLNHSPQVGYRELEGPCSMVVAGPSGCYSKRQPQASLGRACDGLLFDARRCGLIGTILKSRMSQYAQPENGWSSDERISHRGWYAVVSIQLVQTRRS